MKSNWYFCAAAPLVAAALGVAQTAQAQSIDSGLLGGVGGDLFAHTRNISVRSRSHPEYQPMGIPVGTFLLSPSLDTSVSEVDNVYALDTPRQADTIFEVAPAATLASQWANNAVEAHATGDFFRYGKFHGENTDDYTVGGSGHLNITHSAEAFASLDYGNHTQPRSASSNYSISSEPATYKLLTASTGAGVAFDRLRVIIQGNLNQYDFKDLHTFSGELIDQLSRNVTTLDIVSRADYAVSPAASIFVQASAHKDDYVADTRPGALPSRTSTGYNSDLGVAFEPAAPFRGSIAFGYQYETYRQSASYPDIQGLHADAQVEWFPTTLTTVSLDAYRTIQATGIIGAAGGLVSHIGLQVDHELLRNLVLSAKGGYDWEDYSSVSIKVQDRYTRFGLDALYSLNRHIQVSLSYDFISGASNGGPDGVQFSMNTVRLGLGYHY